MKPFLLSPSPPLPFPIPVLIISLQEKGFFWYIPCGCESFWLCTIQFYLIFPVSWVRAWAGELVKLNIRVQLPPLPVKALQKEYKHISMPTMNKLTPKFADKELG